MTILTAYRKVYRGNFDNIDVCNSKFDYINFNSLDHCKNDQKSTILHNEKLWAEGKLVAYWNNEIIHPKDRASFEKFQEAELARFKAPVLTAVMIDLVKRMEKKKIKVIFHITGVPEAIRYFKQRLHHLNDIEPIMRNHPKYRDLFKNATTVLELLGDSQLWYSIGTPVATGNTRTNGLVYDYSMGNAGEAAFQAFVKNSGKSSNNSISILRHKL